MAAKATSEIGFTSHVQWSPLLWATRITIAVLNVVIMSQKTENRRKCRSPNGIAPLLEKVHRPLSQKPAVAPPIRPARLATPGGTPCWLNRTKISQSTPTWPIPTMPKAATSRPRENHLDVRKASITAYSKRIYGCTGQGGSIWLVFFSEPPHGILS
jgi:hypothetical protein